jgi:hypothetical protein
VKKESLLWKQRTIFVVLLFCGLAFAPSIHANISKESELVEITTEVCGLPGQKPQTIQLSKSDADAVDKLFDEIKVKLDTVETREEAVEIFNDAIVELDKYGLLGGLSVEEAQKLVTGRFHNTEFSDIKEKFNTGNKQVPGEIDNLFCLMTGEANHLFFYTIPIYLLMPVMGISLFIVALSIYTLPVLSGFFGMIFLFSFLLSERLFVFASYRQPVVISAEMEFRNSSGWIYTEGIKGNQSLNGSFSSNINYYITRLRHYIWFAKPGAIGFTGLKWGSDSFDSKFLGYAILVKVKQVE